MSPKIFPSLKDPKLIDEKLMYFMPDLITMDHVQVDACILVIYYCILWQGCFRLDDSSSPSSTRDPQIIRQILICCLRAVSVWQREATGSITDFIAAMFMVRPAQARGTKEHRLTHPVPRHKPRQRILIMASAGRCTSMPACMPRVCTFIVSTETAP